MVQGMGMEQPMVEGTVRPKDQGTAKAMVQDTT